MAALRKLLKWPLHALLRRGGIRRRVSYELRRQYYHDLQVVIPLTHGLCCPIHKQDHIHSFSEIFVTNEYGDFQRDIPLPRRWIDLGCHAGYFSMYLAWHCKRAGINDFEALLIDADPRVEESIEHLVRMNKLEANFKFQPGLIQAGAGTREFGLREVMASSSDLSGACEKASVRILDSQKILETFAPPYDLIKVDIEGAETAFITAYEAVLAQAKNLILEWHSNSEEGAEESEMTDLLAKRSFELVRVLQEKRTTLIGGQRRSAGCHLYKRAR